MLTLRICRSARGATLIDFLLAMTIFSVVMTAAYSSLRTQIRAHGTQRVLTETLNDSRMAVRIMAEQVAMAGFGVPSATIPSTAPKLVTATTSQLSFWTKTSASHTYLTAPVAANSTSVTVLSAASLTPGTTFYVTDTARWYAGTVQQVNGTSVTISPALAYAFAAGSVVTPVELVTFQLVGDQLQRNGHTIIRNVSALSFAYDSATLGAIRRITITLSAQTRAQDWATAQPLSVARSAQIAPPDLAL